MKLHFCSRFLFFGDFWEENVVDVFTLLHNHESRSPQSFTFRRWVQLRGTTRKATRRKKWVKIEEETYFKVDPLASVQWKYIVENRESVDFGVRLTQFKTPAIKSFVMWSKLPQSLSSIKVSFISFCPQLQNYVHT